MRFGSPDYDGWEARAIDLAQNRNLRRARRGRDRAYGAGVTRDGVWAAYESLINELDAFQGAADADLAALLREELRGSIGRYEELKRRAGALDFVDLLLRARDLLVDHAPGPPGVSVALHASLRRRIPGHGSAAGRNPAASGSGRSCRTRLAPHHPGARQAVSRRRSQAGDLPLPPRRRRDVSRGLRPARIARGEARLPAHELPRDPRDPARRERRVRAADGRRSRNAAGAVRRAVAHTVPNRQVNRRSSSCRCPSRTASGALPATPSRSRCPTAVGAFVHWLVTASGWTVTERTTRDELPIAVPIQPRHICILFRRFVHFGQDVTRRYVEALEARGVPHLLVGGKSFHDREEVETMRAALAAVEWPDDELSVFATLRGALFAIDDESLFLYRHRHKSLPPVPRRGGPGVSADRRGAAPAAPSAQPAQLSAGRRHDHRAAERDTRARRLRAAKRRRAGAGQRAARRRARAAVRGERRHFIPRVRGGRCASRRTAGRRPKRRFSRRAPTACAS